MPGTRPIAERFWEKVDVPENPNECWTWKARHHNGYGYFTPVHGTSVAAHRFAFTLLRGEIPEGLVCDHLCRNRGCVNPQHIELTSIGENVRRGNPGKHLSERTHCNHGHQFTPDNIYWQKGYRTCRRCILDRINARRAGEREARENAHSRESRRGSG